MMIKWGNCMSNSINVSNGVRQGSVLSPYLFAVYIDGLSSQLNKINASCIAKNLKLNHIMYADRSGQSAIRSASATSATSTIAKVAFVFNCFFWNIA